MRGKESATEIGPAF